MVTSLLSRASASILDFVLPVRCAGCGDIVGEAGEFCPSCWAKIDWLGSGGCERCAMPLEGFEQDLCAACETAPPQVQRTVSAVRYDDLTRTLALKLKYGRRVGLAKVMARSMARHVVADSDTIITPVPLHPTRLWRRGFNQAALLAREIGRQTGGKVVQDLLVRRRATDPMTNMSPAQRDRNVRGAMAIREGRVVEGSTIVLVDDVRTSGATIEACAKPLLKAGARRVEAIVWARVVRPRDITR